MGACRMIPRLSIQATHRISVDLHQASRLAHPASVGDMLQHRPGFFFRQTRVLQSGAFAPGEVGLTGPTRQHTNLVFLTAPPMPTQIADTALAVIGAGKMLTTAGFEWMHRRSPLNTTPAETIPWSYSETSATQDNTFKLIQDTTKE